MPIKADTRRRPARAPGLVPVRLDLLPHERDALRRIAAAAGTTMAATAREIILEKIGKSVVQT